MRRGFWLALLLGHAPALLRRALQLISQSNTEFETEAFILLLVVCVFFALKILDFRCLRFRTDRRSLCTLAVAAGLMHWHMLPVAVGGQESAQRNLIAPELLLVSTLLPLRRLVRRMVCLVSEILATARLSSAQWHIVSEIQLWRIRHHISLNSLPTRGPPAVPALCGAD